MAEEPAFRPWPDAPAPGGPHAGVRQPDRPGPGAVPPGDALRGGGPRVGPVWAARPAAHSPSGLFPAGPPPNSHPTYREPHPARVGGVFAGAGSAAAWLVAFGLLGRDLRGYVLWTLFAGGVAWLVALVLTARGDRGVGAGIALAGALGWAVAAAAVAVRWSSSADWPLW